MDRQALPATQRKYRLAQRYRRTHNAQRQRISYSKCTMFSGVSKLYVLSIATRFRNGYVLAGSSAGLLLKKLRCDEIASGVVRPIALVPSAWVVLLAWIPVYWVPKVYGSGSDKWLFKASGRSITGKSFPGEVGLVNMELSRSSSTVSPFQPAVCKDSSRIVLKTNFSNNHP